MMKRTVVAALLSACALAAPLAHPVEAHHRNDSAGAQGPTHSGAISEGEVRRVDKDAKKITLRHGPLQNLDMPAMTMVFQVKDPAMLDQVKAGDKVKFRAEKVDAAYTITVLQPAK
jgi:Cu/Ag efflux protein CusF